MKKIGYNNWLINQQKENKLERHKKVTLFRRYWDSENKEYTWENTIGVEIDQDIIKCGKITWKSDTDQLNIWKIGNASLVVDNSHGKWDINKSDSYFNGYVSFLSMIRIEIGFIAGDGSVYEIFSYQGLISDRGIELNNDNQTANIKIISLDYLLDSVNAEDVSTRPVDPELQYENANIYSSTTIGKTGSGWATNAYQYKIVRIYSGTGLAQERLILSNTADTITVNTWETTPDATSDFEIVGEYMGVGNDFDTEYITVQPGVGKIAYVWQTDDVSEQGKQYTVSQLNELTLGAKVTFNTPPVTGKRIVCDYIYWYQDETFKYLVEKILDLANITDRYIQDVIFPTQVETEWEQTSQSDWNAGSLINLNTSRVSGDMIINDNTGGEAYDPYSSVPDTGALQYGNLYSYLMCGASGNYYQIGQKIRCGKSLYIKKISMYVQNVYGTNVNNVQLHICADDAGGSQPGSVLSSSTVYNIGHGGYRWFDFEFPDYRMSYSAVGVINYWVLLRSNTGGNERLLVKGTTHTSPIGEGVYYKWGTDPWTKVPSASPYMNNISFKCYFHPYYTYGYHISQTLDCGASLTAYGKFSSSEGLNNGIVEYYTQSKDADTGWSTTFDTSTWDAVDQFGNITSTVKRYLRVLTYIVPNYPGLDYSYDDIDTPAVHDYLVKYYVSTYNPALANFISQSGKSAIEIMAKLANYEMGFFTDFNDSENMTWDKEYDGDVMPQTEGWTENKGYNASGLIVSNELVISGSVSFDSVGTITETGNYIYNKVFFVEHNSNLYMSSGCIDTVYRYDGGTTWTSIGTLPYGSPTGVTSLISFNGDLYAGVHAAYTGIRGVYKWDGGTTWTKVSGLPSSAIRVYGLCEFDGDMYCGTSYGEAYRYDGGTTWTNVGNIFYSDGNYSVRYLAVYNGNLYAGADTNSQNGSGSVYVYNGGSSWTKLKDYDQGFFGHVLSCDDYLYVGFSTKIDRYDGSEWSEVGSTNNQIGSFGVYNDALFIGSEQNSNLYVYDGEKLIYLNNPGNSVWGMTEFNNKLYVGVGVLSTEVFEFQSAGYCFYDIVDTDLDPRNGWTVEANVEKTDGSDENFQIAVNDGTFHTRVAITNQGYIKLLQYDKDNLVRSKKADFTSGVRHRIKIARKGTLMKIYVDDDIVLCSKSNSINSYQKVYFGQLEETYNTFESIVDWLRYNDSVPCFETFYLPRYYFQSKESESDSQLYLSEGENFEKLYNYEYGISRVYNHVRATYGEYNYYATPYSELDDMPHSENTYGKRYLEISGEDFLQKEDTNIAVGVAKRYYQYQKFPRRRFKVLSKYLFQLDLSDKIYVSCTQPFILIELPCKIIGIVVDIDNFYLDLDCEEIL